MNNLEAAKIIGHSQLFNGLEVRELSDLIVHGKLVSHPAKAVLLSEGSKVSELHVILEGHVEVAKKGAAKVAQLGRGSFFGEISLFGMSLGATAEVSAPQGCTCFLIGKQKLEAWLKQYPKAEAKFFRHLSTQLCERLYSTTEKLVF